ncbi:MAG TPA: GNAT family N-acetyltransferase [Candidatus Sulfotelmatobacter sp.]|nr:GNAT family N-acetyltransferase [Candidatus Sulfotelmatobacter sp.]
MTRQEFPKTITLRDGSTASVRFTAPGDEARLLAFYRELPETDRRFLKDDVTTEAWAARFLRRIERGEVQSLLVEQHGKVVGEATLYRATHGWSAHVAELRIAVAPACRRRGLATILARLLVGLATDQGADKVVVEVVESQVAAIRVVEKLGFRREAVLRGHVKDISGTRRDLLILSTDVSHIWAAMEDLLADSQDHLA